MPEAQKHFKATMQHLKTNEAAIRECLPPSQCTPQTRYSAPCNQCSTDQVWHPDETRHNSWKIYPTAGRSVNDGRLKNGVWTTVDPLLLVRCHAVVFQLRPGQLDFSIKKSSGCNHLQSKSGMQIALGKCDQLVQHPFRHTVERKLFFIT
jgi:hypothetical protein